MSFSRSKLDSMIRQRSRGGMLQALPWHRDVYLSTYLYKGKDYPRLPINVPPPCGTQTRRHPDGEEFTDYSDARDWHAESYEDELWIWWMLEPTRKAFSDITNGTLNMIEMLPTLRLGYNAAHQYIKTELLDWIRQVHGPNAKPREHFITRKVIYRPVPDLPGYSEQDEAVEKTATNPLKLKFYDENWNLIFNVDKHLYKLERWCGPPRYFGFAPNADPKINGRVLPNTSSEQFPCKRCINDGTSCHGWKWTSDRRCQRCTDIGILCSNQDFYDERLQERKERAAAEAKEPSSANANRYASTKRPTISASNITTLPRAPNRYAGSKTQDPGSQVRRQVPASPSDRTMQSVATFQLSSLEQTKQKSYVAASREQKYQSTPQQRSPIQLISPPGSKPGRDTASQQAARKTPHPTSGTPQQLNGQYLMSPQSISPNTGNRFASTQRRIPPTPSQINLRPEGGRRSHGRMSVTPTRLENSATVLSSPEHISPQTQQHVSAQLHSRHYGSRTTHATIEPTMQANPTSAASHSGIDSIARPSTLPNTVSQPTANMVAKQPGKRNRHSDAIAAPTGVDISDHGAKRRRTVLADQIMSTNPQIQTNMTSTRQNLHQGLLYQPQLQLGNPRYSTSSTSMSGLGQPGLPPLYWPHRQFQNNVSTPTAGGSFDLAQVQQSPHENMSARSSMMIAPSPRQSYTSIMQNRQAGRQSPFTGNPTPPRATPSPGYVQQSQYQSQMYSLPQQLPAKSMMMNGHNPHPPGQYYQQQSFSPRREQRTPTPVNLQQNYHQQYNFNALDQQRVPQMIGHVSSSRQIQQGQSRGGISAAYPGGSPVL